MKKEKTLLGLRLVSNAAKDFEIKVEKLGYKKSDIIRGMIFYFLELSNEEIKKMIIEGFIKEHEYSLKYIKEEIG